MSTHEVVSDFLHRGMDCFLVHVELLLIELIEPHDVFLAAKTGVERLGSLRNGSVLAVYDKHGLFDVFRDRDSIEREPWLPTHDREQVCVVR